MMNNIFTFVKPIEKLSSDQKRVITVLTICNALSWFDVYSFVFNSDIFADLFFPMVSRSEGILYAFLIFGLGFVLRPVGALFLGRIGDRLGRRVGLITSLALVTAPTFLIGLLPPYERWGSISIIILACLRIIQSFATGAEVSAIYCYLYEIVGDTNKKYVTSWNALGNQVGSLIAIIETLILENFLPENFLYSYGWRISFITGGIIGIRVWFYSRKMHETPTFHAIAHKVDHETYLGLLWHHRRLIVTGISFGSVVASTFYMIATYVPTYLDERLGLSKNQNLFFSFLVILFITVLIPIFGRLGDHFKAHLRKICCISTLIIMGALVAIYYSMKFNNMLWTSISFGVLLIPVACLSALIAYLIAHLFSPSVRFSGVGVAANFSDGIIGGLAPFISLLLVNTFHKQNVVIIYVFLCSVLSLVYYFRKII